MEKYNGAVYLIKNMTGDISGVDILPEGVGTENDRKEGIYHQFKVLGNTGQWRAESWVHSSSTGTGSLKVYFPIPCMEANETGPYTFDTPVNHCGGLESCGQEAPFQIQDDGSFLWGKTVTEEDPYDLAKVLLGGLKVLSFDERQVDVFIEEFPIFDQATKKVYFIPVTYHFERE